MKHAGSKLKGVQSANIALQLCFGRAELGIRHSIIIERRIYPRGRLIA